MTPKTSAKFYRGSPYGDAKCRWGGSKSATVNKNFITACYQTFKFSTLRRGTYYDVTMTSYTEKLSSAGASGGGRGAPYGKIAYP